MSYRLLALDLDGTLLTHRKRVSPQTRDALDRAAHDGLMIVLATGRSFEVARYFCDGLTLTAPQITYNGAIIYDPTTRQELSRYLVPSEHVVPALDFFAGVGAAIAYFAPGALYLDRSIGEPQTWLPGNTGTPHIVDDWGPITVEPCIKIVGHDDRLRIAEIRPLAVEALGDALYVTQTAATLLEMLHPEVSKGAALRRLAHMLGIARDEIIAFGDSHNDIDMLQFAGVGVAMGNASQEVKDSADLIAGSNEEDGIAEALFSLGVVA